MMFRRHMSNIETECRFLLLLGPFPSQHFRQIFPPADDCTEFDLPQCTTTSNCNANISAFRNSKSLVLLSLSTECLNLQSYLFHCRLFVIVTVEFEWDFKRMTFSSMFTPRWRPCAFMIDHDRFRRTVLTFCPLQNRCPKSHQIFIYN